MNGVFIPDWVCNKSSLSLVDKVVLAIVSKDSESKVSNGDLAELCGCTKRTITSSVARLVDQGLVEILSNNGTERVMRCLR